MFDRIDFQRIVTAAAGAAILSTACIGAAVAPAKAADVAPLTVSDWQKSVDKQIDRTLRFPSGVAAMDGHAIATVAVKFDDHGGFDGASIAKSSGNEAIDAEALRTARTIRYPVLPSGLRGRAQTVSMQLLFAEPKDGDAAREQMVADQMAADAHRAVDGLGLTQTASR
ncbi:MAG: TonB family protein [Sphingomonadaceae bacterium]|nr:TonB family protein [Sphingomonadaceae bacterium]